MYLVIASEESFIDYFNTMPWLAVRFDGVHRKQREEISNRFGVNGIPKLVFLNGKTGKMALENGVNAVRFGMINFNNLFPMAPPVKRKLSTVDESSENTLEFSDEVSEQGGSDEGGGEEEKFSKITSRIRRSCPSCLIC